MATTRGRLLLLTFAIALAACSSGSQSDGVDASPGVVSGTGATTPGGDDTTPPPPPDGNTGPMTATLAWADASGPVAGYRVEVSRNGAAFRVESDVSRPSVVVSASGGDTLVVRVAAFDAVGNLGPFSPPSNPIHFDTDGNIAALTSGDRSVASAGSGGFATASVDESGDTTSAMLATVPPEEKTRLDFDGDRATDLLWEAPAPDVAMRIMSFRDGALETDLDFDRPTADLWVVGAGDFDGDGLADILWESEGGFLGFSSTLELLETAPNAPLVVMGALRADEVVVATGDSDGDGRVDLLVRDETSGAHVVWLVDAEGVAEVVDLDVAIDVGSHAVGSGDFDGDGRADVVWRGADGTLFVSFMDGAVAVASLDIASAFGHEVLASGDFNGDGVDDLVHRDPATGGVGVLLMGAQQQPVPWSTAVDAGLGWDVLDAGDYDGDGTADLLWESEAGLALGLHPASAGAPTFLAIDAGDWIPVASP
jgi:hypothetical protein